MRKRTMTKPGSILIMSAVMLLTICLFSAGVSAQVSDDSVLVMDSHIIQVFQIDESPNILVVQETITINNTSNLAYSGTILLPAQDPMYVNALINDTEPLRTFQVNDDMFAVETSGNRSIYPGTSIDIRVEYAVNFEGDSIEQLVFRKKIEYETHLVMLIIKPRSDYQVTGEGIELTKATSAEFAGAYISPHFTPMTASPGDEYVIIISKSSSSTDPVQDEATGDIFNYVVIAFIIILIVAIALTMITRMRRSGGKERSISVTATKKPSEGIKIRKNGQKRGVQQKSAQKRAAPKGSVRRRPAEKASAISEEDILMRKRKEMIEKKSQILAGKKHRKSEYKANNITRSEFLAMDGKYQEKLKEINKKIAKIDKLLDRPKGAAAPIEAPEHMKPKGKPETKDELKLQARKNTLLSVLKNLEKNHDAGDIPDDVYGELKAEYKQEAVEVLKALDELDQN